MKIGLIGKGAIAGYAQKAIELRGHEIGAVLLRNKSSSHTNAVTSVSELPADIDVMLDCAGHAALTSYGPKILSRGIDLITVSLGALADPEIYATLEAAAKQGRSKLHLASGAIGALDCLQAARVGQLPNVAYIGRKPPAGWKGSPAETKLELDALKDATTHFQGTAREAALAYPKNANVAAAVALAGVGFDATCVQLIADPNITENIHEIQSSGDFGSFNFKISGQALPENPRSSALAAMSVISKLDQIKQSILI